MIKNEVVLTGIGVLSSIGITKDSFWTSLCEGKSGIGYLQSIETQMMNRPIGSEVPDFRPKDYIKPKKNIKVMSRDIQMGVVSVAHACQDAQLITDGEERSVDPERIGVIFGCDLIGLELSELVDAFKAGIQCGKHDFSTWGHSAMEKIMPLWMLKYLPNMPACHIGIALDARGPNNTPTLDRGSSLSALIEAFRVLERGDADVMVCGGCGNKINPTVLARGKSYNLAPWSNDPQTIPRPFDVDRVGTVIGEGAAAFVLERKEFAQARGVQPIATIRGAARTNAPTGRIGIQEESIIRAIQLALKEADRTPKDLGHLNAEGLGTIFEDAIEAQAIQKTLNDIPVFTGKGHFGNLGSGTGAVELAASLLAIQHKTVPATRNCQNIATDCPINVINNLPYSINASTFLKINHSNTGRAFAVVFE
ncbi:MAG: beta-ketoacyl-[acyl-carrier-protein] synthase family protein [Planctomycetia bacterium]|nr:beta-ketoacyl-[acyl-carrier-protein] synthase family protein [Planctomycetia bacterium]